MKEEKKEGEKVEKEVEKVKEEKEAEKVNLEKDNVAFPIGHIKSSKFEIIISGSLINSKNGETIGKPLDILYEEDLINLSKDKIDYALYPSPYSEVLFLEGDMNDILNYLKYNNMENTMMDDARRIIEKYDNLEASDSLSTSDSLAKLEAEWKARDEAKKAAEIKKSTAELQDSLERFRAQSETIRAQKEAAEQAANNSKKGGLRGLFSRFSKK